MRVAELWRYPVKSMGGERLDASVVDERGVHADRLWAVKDLELDAVTTARRLPALMGCSARFAATPPVDAGPGKVAEVVVTFPDGAQLTSNDAAIHARLSDLVGRRVELVALPPRDDRKAYRGVFANQADVRRQFDLRDDEPLPDFSMFPLRKLAELARYATPVGAFHDAYPIHLLTTASLDAMAAEAPQASFDVRRFRPSVVIDSDGTTGLEEFGWCGAAVRAGDVELAPEIPTLRCSMPTRAQPGLEADADVLRTIRTHADRCLGVYAGVSRGGRISVGDEVHVGPPAAPTVMTRLRAAARRGVTRASAATMPRGR